MPQIYSARLGTRSRKKVDGSYRVRALDIDRNARLISITDKATWIIEGVHYRWLRLSFKRADMIFVLRPNVFVPDWRILKRFVSRKFRIMTTKKENALDLSRLIEWNHKYDGENLKRAMDFIREFKHKVDTCRLCRRSFEPCRGTLDWSGRFE
jgi:hypothetical protein